MRGGLLSRREVRWSRRPAPVAVALIILAAGAGHAWARKHSTVRLPASSRFSARGSHGYRIEMLADRGVVTISVGHRHAFASYSARGAVSERAVDARLGGFGRVDVRFEPAGGVKREKPFPGCHGAAAETRRGVFSGVIRFRGERGYTQLRLRRVHGETTTAAAWRCGSATPHPTATNGRTVSLLAALPHGREFFTALGTEAADGTRPGGCFFIAGAQERRGRVRIARLALVIGDAPTFGFDPALESATVTPPPPFAGTATLHRNPDGSTSWTGSLTISLPGAPGMALTGAGFRATLSAAPGTSGGTVTQFVVPGS